MTQGEFLEHILTEQNKVDAPTLLDADYNYWVNKGIYQYVNEQYNFYDVNQQMTDNIGFLRKPFKAEINSREPISLPDDYMHLLSCSVIYSNNDQSCLRNDVTYGARRMTSDYKGQIFNNYYLKPKKTRPYYMVTGNKLEIFNDHTPCTVVIDYLSKPEEYNLDQDDLDSLNKKLRIPDYVCYEIINKVVKLILESSSDPRIQTHMSINQSIAPPIPQQTKTK